MARGEIRGRYVGSTVRRDARMRTAASDCDQFLSLDTAGFGIVRPRCFRN